MFLNKIAGDTDKRSVEHCCQPSGIQSPPITDHSTSINLYHCCHNKPCFSKLQRRCHFQILQKTKSVKWAWWWCQGLNAPMIDTHSAVVFDAVVPEFWCRELLLDDNSHAVYQTLANTHNVTCHTEQTEQKNPQQSDPGNNTLSSDSFYFVTKRLYS